MTIPRRSRPARRKPIRRSTRPARRTSVRRKTRPPRKQKSERARLIEELDAIARKRAHAKGACENCGRTPPAVGLQWAHGWRREYYSVRWLNDNGRCLCAGCHWMYTNNGNLWEAWLQVRLGMERYLEVQKRAFTVAHYSEADLREILEVMKAGGDQPWCQESEGFEQGGETL